MAHLQPYQPLWTAACEALSEDRVARAACACAVAGEGGGGAKRVSYAELLDGGDGEADGDADFEPNLDDDGDAGDDFLPEPSPALPQRRGRLPVGYTLLC